MSEFSYTHPGMASPNRAVAAKEAYVERVLETDMSRLSSLFYDATSGIISVGELEHRLTAPPPEGLGLFMNRKLATVLSRIDHVSFRDFIQAIKAVFEVPDITGSESVVSATSSHFISAGIVPDQPWAPSKQPGVYKPEDHEVLLPDIPDDFVFADGSIHDKAFSLARALSSGVITSRQFRERLEGLQIPYSPRIDFLIGKFESSGQISFTDFARALAELIPMGGLDDRDNRGVVCESAYREPVGLPSGSPKRHYERSGDHDLIMMRHEEYQPPPSSLAMPKTTPRAKLSHGDIVGWTGPCPTEELGYVDDAEAMARRAQFSSQDLYSTHIRPSHLGAV